MKSALEWNPTFCHWNWCKPIKIMKFQIRFTFPHIPWDKEKVLIIIGPKNKYVPKSFSRRFMTRYTRFRRFWGMLMYNVCLFPTILLARFRPNAEWYRAENVTLSFYYRNLDSIKMWAWLDASRCISAMFFSKNDIFLRGRSHETSKISTYFESKIVALHKGFKLSEDIESKKYHFHAQKWPIFFTFFAIFCL